MQRAFHHLHLRHATSLKYYTFINGYIMPYDSNMQVQNLVNLDSLQLRRQLCSYTTR